MVDQRIVRLADLQQALTSLTDDELAARFTERHGQELRYVAAWGAWLRWRDTSWQRETTLETFDLARIVCRDAVADLRDAKLRSKVMSLSTRSAVENLARADRVHAATTDQWDSDLMTVGTPSCAGTRAASTRTKP
jgi:putative DNA primase/helicase